MSNDGAHPRKRKGLRLLASPGVSGLLLYALVLAFLVTVATNYRHHVATNRKLTLLAREITLARAAADDAAEAAEAARGER